MRLLITGATGFIGSSLALRAGAAGHAVRAAGMENTPAETANLARLRDAGCEVIVADLQQLAGDPAAFAGVDAVIHLAAAQHEMNVPDEHFRQVNVAGTEALMAAAAAAGVRRFVYGSTIGVYGDREGRLSEASPPAPDNIYGVTKLEAERKVLAGLPGLETTAVRISETYGPGDRRLLKLFKAVAKGRFPVIGNGRNLHHPVYIDDLADGLLIAAAHPAAAGELFVLAGRNEVTTDEMVAAVATALGRPRPGLRLPLAPVMAAATVMELGLRPLGIQPPLHRRRMDFFKKSFSLDGAKARERLGYKPQVDFAEGARRTAAWYRDNGLL